MPAHRTRVLAWLAWWLLLRSAAVTPGAPLAIGSSPLLPPFLAPCSAAAEEMGASESAHEPGVAGVASGLLAGAQKRGSPASFLLPQQPHVALSQKGSLSPRHMC